MAHHGQGIMDVLSIASNAIGNGINDLYAARDKHLGKPEGPFWDKVSEVSKWLDTSSISPIKHLNDFDDAGTKIGENVGEKLNLAPGLGGLLIGSVIPGPQGEIKALGKARKIKPETAKKMAARDLMVDKNQFPNRGDMRPADFRGISGDVQGGIKGEAIRMEARPDYQIAGTGLPIGEFNSKTTRNFTPHHRMGIQDNRAFFAGKTGPEAAKRREELAVGGLHPGNTGANYQPVFDGVKSSKATAKTGIKSHDHDQIHKQSDELRARMGIKMDRKNRDNDTWHGVPIKDLPNELQRNLQIQLALQDELIIDKVQGKRFKAFKDKFGHLPQNEQRDILLNNPKKFANLSTHK
jgi:hypothetical protein